MKMPKTTTIRVSLETWQRLNVIRHELGLGFSFEDAIKECLAVRNEHYTEEDP